MNENDREEDDFDLKGHSIDELEKNVRLVLHVMFWPSAFFAVIAVVLTVFGWPTKGRSS